MKQKSTSVKLILFAVAIGMAVSSPVEVKADGRGYHIFGGAANMFGIEVVAPKDEVTEESSFIEYIDTRDKSGTICDGISIGGVDVSGMSYDEALSRVNSYVSELRMMSIHLSGVNDSVTSVTAGDLGLHWDNENVVIDAINFGRSGNIVTRYKEKKDLEQHPIVYDLQLSFDREIIERTVEEQAKLHDIPPKDATLTREDGQFMISEGVTGYVVDKEQSVNQIVSDLMGWRGEDITIELHANVTEPKGNRESLSVIKDVIGRFTTSFSSSGPDRSGNVRTGTDHINGTILYPGESFSTYAKVAPFTEENGYYLAGSYANGMVVESLGGGICQVSSTLYNAVLRAELQVDERSPHSMIVSYVKMSSDAAISGTYKDFKFTNNKSFPIYIEGYTTADKEVVFNIYGVEDRPSNRTIEFESVELEKNEPEGDKIVEDSKEPAGFISIQSPHTGYSGEFWKIIKIDGVETERVRVNRSTYQATPRTATVGTKTDDPEILEAVRAAIRTGNIDECKAALSNLKSAGSSKQGEDSSQASEEKVEEKPSEEKAVENTEGKPSEEKSAESSESKTSEEKSEEKASEEKTEEKKEEASQSLESNISDEQLLELLGN